MQKRALLIGVSEYNSDLTPLPSSENDVSAMAQVLKDPEAGAFNEVKTLINPHSHEMQRAIEELFASCAKHDLALVFFSGHGIKDNRNKLFFATQETYKHETGELMQSSAVSAMFVRDQMTRCRAKRQALILDCCFSGAFQNDYLAKNDDSIDFVGQLGAEGHVVLTSSSSTQYSFESKDAKLSVYTHHLVKGIETGAADINQDGKISIHELHEYATRKVQDELPHITPKIIVLKDQGFDIVLARVKPKLQEEPDITEKRIALDHISIQNKIQIDDDSPYNPIPSLLDPLRLFIERLIEQVKNRRLTQGSAFNDDGSKWPEFILEAIRIASDANLVFTISHSKGENGWKLRSQSNLASEDNEIIYGEILKEEILSTISVESIFTTGRHGLYRFLEDETTKNPQAFIVIPLNLSHSDEFMVVCGLKRGSDYINDAYTNIVTSFFAAIENFGLTPERVEAHILDTLKHNYGFLPLAFYNRRYELFCNRLAQINMHFEPVLDVRRIAISGWEALARDPESLTAPKDLFDAAEIWGRKFTIQLDIELLKRSVKQYIDLNLQHNRERDTINTMDMAPLSVNVYPESLMRTAYFETVAALTQPDENGDPLLPSHCLILEISEKVGFPTYNNGVKLKSPFKNFKNRLIKYTQELGIQFGIDDFGVGHASVSRLAGLRPPYIKIDRDILHQQQVETIIQFVHNIAARSNELHITKIIVEGLDEEAPITLYDLKKLGVAYVQGHIIGKPASLIYGLTPEKRERLKLMLQGG
ncbi:caspase, EACC1-associated type [Leptothoe kymatousa]|uniref:EAL domain-containing protein n=1 Tax=Leptothoe kymatousa TAU-MAC 1615 TaxID=2364775 RepID=A0ABS5Y2B6_9CYAN|nr:caspase family protein [Leptothoe kymatousa]MBT9311761.1 EAL domain-containing protein [Leptothoe kymatousa TAU-MAC 1615]